MNNPKPLSGGGLGPRTGLSGGGLGPRTGLSGGGLGPRTGLSGGGLGPRTGLGYKAAFGPAVKEPEKTITEKTRPLMHKPFGFALAGGVSGARIHYGCLISTVTRATFGKEFPSGVEINHLLNQSPIPNVEVHPPENLDGPDQLATELSWFGDVWLYWEVDEEGNVLLCDVRGPEQPEINPIPLLDFNLEREDESDGGGGSGGSPYSYAVKIGSVSEENDIIQEVSGDVTWAVTIFQGDGSSSSSSFVSSDSVFSSDDSQGSSKDTAIVPASWAYTGYTALFAMESPDVRFEDVFADIAIEGCETRRTIDPRFLEVIEPGTLRVVGLAADLPYPVGAVIEGGELVLRALTDKRRRPTTVNVKFSALRKGFRTMRFPLRTAEQFAANEARLAMPPFSP
jgi:hypothetical protein